MKKIIALILALALCFALCACGRDSQEGMEELRSPEMTGARFSPEKTTISGEAFNGISAEAAGDSIVCVGTLGDSPENAEYSIYRINPVDNKAKQIEGVSLKSFNFLDTLGDGSALVTYSDSNGDLHFIDISSDDTISEYVPELPEEMKGVYYPAVFLTDGGYILSDGTKLTKIDRDGQPLVVRELPGWTSILRRLGGGFLGVCQQNDAGKYTVYELGHDLSIETELELEETFSEILQCGSDGEIFVSIDDVIYRVNYKTGEKQSYANVFSSGCVGSGAFVFLDNERFFDCTKARAPALWRPFVEGEKLTLTLAAYLPEEYDYNAAQQLKNALNSFNENSEEYFIELVDYAAYGEGGYEILLSDISTGNTADIYDLQYLDSALAGKGVLQDLYPFFEAERGIDVSALNSSVLKTLEYDGKLFSLVPSFTATAYVGRASVIGGTLDAERFFTLAEQYGAGAVFDDGMSKRMFFTDLLTSYGAELVDYNKAQCSFDTPLFKRCLEYASQLPDELSLEEQQYYGWGAYSGESVFKKCFFQDPVRDYLRCKSLFGGDMAACGFPAKPGGAGFTPTIMLGMAANSPNQAGVWDFFKFLLSDNYQWNCVDIPLNTSIAEQIISAQTELWKESKISILIYSPSGTEIPDEITVPYLASDENTAEEIMNIIRSIDSVNSFSPAILDVIIAETQKLADGVQTLDQAAASIQSRASIYLSEQFG